MDHQQEMNERDGHTHDRPGFSPYHERDWTDDDFDKFVPAHVRDNVEQLVAERWDGDWSRYGEQMQRDAERTGQHGDAVLAAYARAQHAKSAPAESDVDTSGAFGDGTEPADAPAPSGRRRAPKATA